MNRSRPINTTALHRAAPAATGSRSGPAGSTLAAALESSESLEAALGAVFTLAREESIAEVRVAGEVVWPVARGAG